MYVGIRKADRELDHDDIVKIALMDKNISSFSSMMFSNEDAYKKGWITIAIDKGGTIVGFTCVRHKVRSPETMLYFLMTHPDYRGLGVGDKLMQEMEQNSPHNTIALKVMKDNRNAISFYGKRGYLITSDSEYGGKGFKMEKKLREGTKDNND